MLRLVLFRICPYLSDKLMKALVQNFEGNTRGCQKVLSLASLDNYGLNFVCMVICSNVVTSSLLHIVCFIISGVNLT